ncbi:MAG: response regulator [Vicinamibacterales bacterium]
MDPAADRAMRHALVADDEALIRWSVAETLTELGMNVSQAADAATTLEAIDRASDEFDVVILDLRMPDVDDLTLLEKVRRLLPSATVILMTAFGTPEIVAGARRLGVQAVLSKPFELDHLRRLVGADDAPVS